MGGGGSHEQLYGRLDASSGEWRDGLLTATLRAILVDARGESSRRHWLVLDGDVDPGWAEGLNSVLDDNKVLTLPSGEQLPLPRHVRIIFETDAPRAATLATVSRAGMIAFADSTLPRGASLSVFLRTLRHGRLPSLRSGEESGHNAAADCARIAHALGPLLRRGGLADRALGWSAAGVLTNLGITSVPIIFTPFSALTHSFLALLRTGLSGLLAVGGNGATADAARIGAVAFAALQTAAGAPHDEAFRVALAMELINAPEAALVALPPTGLSLHDASLSDGGDGKGLWTPWAASLPTPRELPPDAVLDTSLVIPTIDAARVTAALRGWLAARSPLILAGPPGSGKTLLINAALASLPDTRAAWLSFSASTTPEGVLSAIEAHCEYSPRGADGGVEKWDLAPLGAPNTWLAVFADEVNLPARDTYGCARALDFLRALIDAGGFWAPLRLRGAAGPGGSPRPSGALRAWVSLRRIQFLGACNPPAGDADSSRGTMPSRLLGAAPVVFVGYSSSATLECIFGLLMKALSRLHPCLPSLAAPLTTASLAVWQAASMRHGPRAAPGGDAPQCVYSPRELSRWLRALHSGLAPLAAAVHTTLTPLFALQLWHFEGARLFAARLPEDVEVAWVHSTLSEALTDALRSVPGGGAIAAATAMDAPSRHFTDWEGIGGGSPGLIGSADAVRVTAALASRIELWADDGCGDAAPVVTPQLAARVVRLTATLAQPLGHALLLGAAGTGKTLAARVAARLLGLRVLPLASSGSGDALDAALRRAMLAAGVDGEAVLLLCDGDLKGSAFLERLNSLLASGEVPGLWDGEARGTLAAAAERAWAGTPLAGALTSEEALARAFAAGVAKNLHVAFCAPPQSSSIGSGCRAASPALFNRCVVEWCAPFDAPTLAAVAHHRAVRGLNLGGWDAGGKAAEALSLWHPPAALSMGSTPADAAARRSLAAARQAREATGDDDGEGEGAGAGENEGKHTLTLRKMKVKKTTLHPGTAYADAIAAVLPLLGAEAARCGAAYSSRDFLDVCRHFRAVFAEGRSALAARAERLSAGLTRLEAAERDVAALREALRTTQAALAVGSRAAQAQLVALGHEQGAAEATAAEARALAADVAIKSAQVEKRDGEVTAALADAEPLLVAARAAVAGITKAHLDELRVLAAPPAPVRLALEAVLVLLDPGGGDGAPSAWPDVKRAIKSSDFIPAILALKSDALSPRARRIVEDKYVPLPDFAFERAQAASRAAGPLQLWVTSQLAYARMLERVAPLRSAAAALKTEANSLEAAAAAAAARAATADVAISRLRDAYSVAVAAVERSRAESLRVEARVAHAARLLGGFSGEAARWQATAAALPRDVLALAPAAALAALTLGIGARLRGAARTALATAAADVFARLGLPASPPDDIVNRLANPVARVAWSSAGLRATDDASLIGIASLLRAIRPPLIVDNAPGRPALRFLNGWLSGEGAGGGGGGARRSLARTSLGGKGRGLPLSASALDIPALSRALDSAVRLGTCLIISNADSLPDVPWVHGILEAAAAAALCRAADAAHESGSLEMGLGGPNSWRPPPPPPPAVVRVAESGSELSVAGSFSLFLHTSHAQITLSLSLSTRMTIISLGGDADEVEAALLGRILRATFPEAEREERALAGARVASAAHLALLEDSLLVSLVAGGGNVLDDARVDGALTATRAAAVSAGEQVAAAAGTRTRLTALRSALTPLAAAGARVHMAAISLGAAARCGIYAWRLETTFSSFLLGLTNVAISNPTAPLPSSVDVFALTRAGLYGLARAALRGVYEAHASALLLSVLIIFARAADTIQGVTTVSIEVTALAEAAAAAELFSPTPATGHAAAPFSPTANTVLPAALVALVAPSTALQFSRLANPTGAPWQAELARSVTNKCVEWCDLARSRGAGGALDALPTGWERAAPDDAAAPLREALRRLAVIALLRPDALPAAVVATAKLVFCSSREEAVFLSPDESLLSVLNVGGSSSSVSVIDNNGDSPSRISPIILLTTPGSDAEGLISRVHSTWPGGAPPPLATASLGPASARIAAEAALRSAESNGTWLLLRNAHLDGIWLAGALGRSAARFASPNFRLLLTAEVPALIAAGGAIAGGSSLPPTLLAACEPVLLEAPAGLGAACARALARLRGAGPSRAPPEMLALIAWLHAAVSERRRYVPIGWSRVYDCGDADLDAAAASADILFAEGKDSAAMHFPALRRLFCGALHGARLETASDTAALDALAKAVFAPRSLEGGALSFETLSSDAAASGLFTPPAVYSPYPLPRDLAGWALWAAALPATLPPAALGLPRSADALSAARAGVEVLRCARALVAITL